MAKSLMSMNMKLEGEKSPDHSYNLRGQGIHYAPAAVIGPTNESPALLDLKQDYEAKGQLKRKIVKYSSKPKKNDTSPGKRGLSVGVEEVENVQNGVNFNSRKGVPVPVRKVLKRSRSSKVVRSLKFLSSSDEIPSTSSQDVNDAGNGDGLQLVSERKDGIHYQEMRDEDQCGRTVSLTGRGEGGGVLTTEVEACLNEIVNASLILGSNDTKKGTLFKFVEPPVLKVPQLDEIMITSLDGIREMVPWTQLRSEQWETIEVFLETRALCLKSWSVYQEAESTWFCGNKVTRAQYYYAVKQHRLLVYQKSIYEKQYNSICELFLWRRSINVIISDVHFDPLGKELDMPSWKAQAATCLPLKIVISHSIYKDTKSDIAKMTNRFQNLKVMACPMDHPILMYYRLQFQPFMKRIQKETTYVVKHN